MAVDTPEVWVSLYRAALTGVAGAAGGGMPEAAIARRAATIADEAAKVIGERQKKDATFQIFFQGR
jgi:hypothetical protein